MAAFNQDMRLHATYVPEQGDTIQLDDSFLHVFDPAATIASATIVLPDMTVSPGLKSMWEVCCFFKKTITTITISGGTTPLSSTVTSGAQGSSFRYIFVYENNLWIKLN